MRHSHFYGLCAGFVMLCTSFALKPAHANNRVALLKLLKPAKPYKKLKRKVRKRLKRGKIPVSSYKKKNKQGKMIAIATAKIIIKRPPAEAYKILLQFDKRAEYMPNLVFAKIKKKLAPNVVYVHQMLKVLWVKVPLHLRIETTPNKKIQWSLIKKGKKNGVKENVGKWEFEAIRKGKHTLLSYSVYTDTGRSIPGFVERMLLRRSLPKLLRNIRRRVHSKGKWKQ